MSIDTILAELDLEIARLTQARALLANSGKVATKFASHKGGAPGLRKPRVLSPEARKRIADAQKRRWAAQKAKAKTK